MLIVTHGLFNESARKMNLNGIKKYLINNRLMYHLMVWKGDYLEDERVRLSSLHLSLIGTLS